MNTVENLTESRVNIDALFAEKTENVKGNLKEIVRDVIKKRARILSLAQKYETPFYLLDEEALEKNISAFNQSFNQELPKFKAFYAIKSNPHPSILKRVIRSGMGLDVSSERELNIGLKAGARQILLSGPGKTKSELALAVKNRSIVTINLDSFGELRKLQEIASKQRVTVKAGVRVFTDRSWSKFGISLKKLTDFLKEAQRSKFANVCGIQMHMSWNEDASPYIEAIETLGRYLKNEVSSSILREIEFLDFGGGFFPFRAEGIYPWATPLGKICKIANDHYGSPTTFSDNYYLTVSKPIETFAKAIGQSIKKHIEPLLSCSYYAEPGRVISNSSMMIVLRVVDVKNPGCIIVDGGINSVGWERFENNYFPLVNLTQPSDKERECLVYGSLCTPDDTWGKFSFAKGFREDDVIVVPNQGAYTYSLAQNFILPIPKVYLLTNRK